MNAQYYIYVFQFNKRNDNLHKLFGYRKYEVLRFNDFFVIKGI